MSLTKYAREHSLLPCEKNVLMMKLMLACPSSYCRVVGVCVASLMDKLENMDVSLLTSAHMALDFHRASVTKQAVIFIQIPGCQPKNINSILTDTFWRRLSGLITVHCQGRVNIS